MTTTAAENERIARRVPEEIVTEGKLDLIKDVFTEEVAEHNPLGEDTGWDEMRAGMETMLAAFPDVSATVLTSPWGSDRHPGNAGSSPPCVERRALRQPW